MAQPGASQPKLTTFRLPAPFFTSIKKSVVAIVCICAHIGLTAQPIEVTAVVIRIAPAIYGTARVGVQIAESAENWLRLFVSWVADDQPATTDAEAESPSE